MFGTPPSSLSSVVVEEIILTDEDLYIGFIQVVFEKYPKIPNRKLRYHLDKSDIRAYSIYFRY
jgi:hypothetical protein